MVITSTSIVTLIIGLLVGGGGIFAIVVATGAGAGKAGNTENPVFPAQRRNSGAYVSGTIFGWKYFGKF